MSGERRFTLDAGYGGLTPDLSQEMVRLGNRYGVARAVNLLPEDHFAEVGQQVDAFYEASEQK